MTDAKEIEDLSGENYSLKEERYRVQTAEAAGMEIVRGDCNTLLFDLDSKDALDEFLVRVKILENKAFAPTITVSKSKSGNFHAVVKLGDRGRELSEAHRIAIQACLGSDWKREFLGVLRNLDKQESVSMLFRPQPLEIVHEYCAEPVVIESMESIR